MESERRKQLAGRLVQLDCDYAAALAQHKAEPNDVSRAQVLATRRRFEQVARELGVIVSISLIREDRAQSACG